MSLQPRIFAKSASERCLWCLNIEMRKLSIQIKRKKCNFRKNIVDLKKNPFLIEKYWNVWKFLIVVWWKLSSVIHRTTTTSLSSEFGCIIENWINVNSGRKKKQFYRKAVKNISHKELVPDRFSEDNFWKIVS